MPPIYNKKATIKTIVPGIEVLTISSVPTIAPVPITLLNNDLCLKFLRTFIKIVYAPRASAALTKARDKIDRPFKPQNPDLYYSNLYIKYY